MKSVTIAGPVEQFNTILEKYICDKQLHLEDAMSVLSNREKLYPFEDANNYDPVIKRVEDISHQSGMALSEEEVSVDYSLDRMNEILAKAEDVISDDNKCLSGYETELERYHDIVNSLDNVIDINVDFSKILAFEFMSYSFGRIPKSSYKTLTTYLSDIDAVFVKTKEDAQYVWGFYFAPSSRAGKVDEVFSSLYFENVGIPAECTGVPQQVQKEYKSRISALEQKISERKSKAAEKIDVYKADIITIYSLAKKRKRYDDIRRKAVHSKEFFYIVGWMPKKEADRLEKQLEGKNEPVMFVATDPDKSLEVKPPTMLRNNPVFKPFELFVKMYGLPDYFELDPTPVLALTYILFFGIMFGDVGQSAVFAILGFLLYRIKKIPLAGIIGTVGISGVIFGFIYGSIFGNEEILTPVISPMHSINQMLMITIGMGVAIIIIGLILNIVNSFRSGRAGDALFGHNGMAGLIFYVTLICTVLSKIVGLFSMPNMLIGIVLAVTVICMYLAEPLGKLVSGNKNWLPKDGMFFVENLFEMFEVILSFFTNTISFLRVGAFAIVHVGMMMVVSVLSQGGGVGGTIVYILGNILVMGLEGLIVGIQVLRLEYYEMFSRYFSGQGREFVSVNKK